MIDKTENFTEKSPDWRINAVIHDGSWYTVGKWAKLAKVKKPIVQKWIEDNSDSVSLINVDSSYRVGYDEVMNWYSKQQGISIHDRIVPNNFPPKIWDGQTEVEALINTPRRRVTEVTITPDDRKLLDKCKSVLRGTAIVRFYRSGIYRVCGLSPNFIEQTLRRGLSTQEFATIKPGRRTIMHYRELSDFSPDFLNNALAFYVPFARTMLRPRMSTLKIYLPTRNDVDMQIAMWVMVALRKFDEKQPVPFSGYLSRVLSFWPYDLPDEALGKELSGFQRNRQKAINKLTRSRNEMHIAEDLIIKEMGIDEDKYRELIKQYRSWLAEHNASEITWENSTNEREGELMWSGEKHNEDTELAHNVSMGICDAALQTNDFRQALQIIATLGSIEEENYSALKNINDDFKASMWASIASANNSEDDVNE
jgi:hypothetical protein